MRISDWNSDVCSSERVRRRRHVGRRNGRVEPAQARAVGRGDPLHRIDDVQGVPQSLRKGPRAAAPVPEDRRDRAEPRGYQEDSRGAARGVRDRSEEHTSELQSLMRNSYAVFCLKNKTYDKNNTSSRQNKYT